MKTTVLSLLLLSVAFAFDSSTYTSSLALHPKYTVYWSVETDTLKLALEVETAGWIGFGIGEPTSGSMPGSDIVTGYVSNGVASIQDRHATAFQLPSTDDCQDWILHSGTENNGKTILELSRKLSTSDHQDRNITAGLNRIVFAFGDDDNIAYHSSNRGTNALEFFPDPNSIVLPEPTETDLVTVNLTMNAYSIPETDTMYACSIFRAPTFGSGTRTHIVKLDRLVHEATRAHVHHFVVYACMGNNEWAENNTNNVVEWCSPFNPDHNCGNVLWAWAPGMGSFNLPPQAGFPMGNGADEISYLVLEVHYDNPTLLSGMVDYSGVSLSYTSQLRAHDAASMILGDTSLTADPIPPAKSATEYEFSCTSACSSTWNHEINVFGDFLHMHKTGAQMWSTIWRNGTFLSELNRVDYYNFGMQQVTPKNMILRPGDRINTHCVYDTTTKSQAVQFGDSSSMEMCYEFVFYWPKLSNDFAFCGFMQGPWFTGEQRNVTSCGNVMGVIIENNPEVPDPVGGDIKLFGSSNTGECDSQTSSNDSSSASHVVISVFVGIIAFFL